MTTSFDGPPIPVDTRAAVLDQFVADETGRIGSRPRGVAHATGLDDVLAVLAWARDSRTPLIPRGAGTSLEGHLPPAGTS